MQTGSVYSDVHTSRCSNAPCLQEGSKLQAGCQLAALGQASTITSGHAKLQSSDRVTH